MRTFVRRIIAILLLLAVSICVVIVIARPGVSLGRLHIDNQSGQQLEEVGIAISDNTFRFVGLPVNSAVELTCPITRESAYKIRVRLASGKTFNTETGYVTRGFDFSDRLVVSVDGLVFERLEVSKPGRKE